MLATFGKTKRPYTALLCIVLDMVLNYFSNRGYRILMYSINKRGNERSPYFYIISLFEKYLKTGTTT